MKGGRGGGLAEVGLGRVGLWSRGQGAGEGGAVSGGWSSGEPAKGELPGPSSQAAPGGVEPGAGGRGPELGGQPGSCLLPSWPFPSSGCACALCLSGLPPACRSLVLQSPALRTTGPGGPSCESWWPRGVAGLAPGRGLRHGQAISQMPCEGSPEGPEPGPRGVRCPSRTCLARSPGWSAPCPWAQLAPAATWAAWKGSLAASQGAAGRAVRPVRSSDSPSAGRGPGQVLGQCPSWGLVGLLGGPR